MKRSAENDLGDYKKKTCGTTLRKQQLQDPYGLVFSKHHLLAAQALKALKIQDLGPHIDAPWPACYSTMKEYPKNIKRKLILEKLPNLAEKSLEEHLSELKFISQAVEHLFEFKFHIAPEFTWPQGAAHHKGIIPQLVELWRMHLEKRHSQTRLEGFQLSSSALSQHSQEAQFGSQPAFNWDLCEVYVFLPEDAVDKTHILHKLSKQTVEIPTTMRVDNTWTIDKNWSDHKAVLVDPGGYPMKVISTFFDLAGVGMSMEDWVNFASVKATALADEEDIAALGRCGNGHGALAVVMSHHGVQARGSAAGLASQVERAAQPPANPH